MENKRVSNLMMRGRVICQGLALASCLVYMDPLDLGRYIRPCLGIRQSPMPSKDSIEYRDAYRKEWSTGDPTRSIDQVRGDLHKKMGWNEVPEWQKKYDEEMAQKFNNMGDSTNKDCNINNDGLRDDIEKISEHGKIASIVDAVMNEKK